MYQVVYEDNKGMIYKRLFPTAKLAWKHAKVNYKFGFIKWYEVTRCYL